MKNKFYIGSIFIVLILVCIFVWAYQRQIIPALVVNDDYSKNAVSQNGKDTRSTLEKEFLEMLSSMDIDFESLSLEDQEKLMTHYRQSKQMTSEAFDKYITEENQKLHKQVTAFDQLNTEDKISWLMENSSGEFSKSLEVIRESENRIADWNASRPQREAEAEKRRLETEAANKWFEEWKRETRELLKELDLKLRSPRSILLDDNVDTTISEDSSESAAENAVSTSQSIVFDSVVSLSKVQSKLKPFLVDLDEKYFDVVVSQTLTSQEIDRYFPMDLDREMLRSRTTEMQKLVVSQVRKLVSDVKGATAEQKRSLARELVKKNFDKDFAKSILSELEKEME
ncbi:hypothetical protein F4X73_15185 [Candidatus Poribacteria bacterium]|nr:hypothetical protein [Candidatus Poribacteria bacterium]